MLASGTIYLLAPMMGENSVLSEGTYVDGMSSAIRTAAIPRNTEIAHTILRSLPYTVVICIVVSLLCAYFLLIFTKAKQKARIGFLFRRIFCCWIDFFDIIFLPAVPWPALPPILPAAPPRCVPYQRRWDGPPGKHAAGNPHGPDRKSMLFPWHDNTWWQCSESPY